VFELGKPVVAAVNGHAIAGGCVLAACADVTLMSAGRIGVPELAVGVPFPRVALEVLRHAVGDAVTRTLVLGTQTYPVDEARALGLVDEVLPPDDLLAAAVDRARALAASIPSDTFAATKAQLRRDAVERMTAYADESEPVTTLWIRRVEDGWTRRYLDAVTRR
jgi:enoyl-CoA hydratase